MHETIVIGAGHAGLAASWHLARRGINHVVLEQGRVGETWRSQRWDSFYLNTPSWMNRLPGEDAGLEPRDGFVAGRAWIEHLEGYAARLGLPVREGAEVDRLQPLPDGTFSVRLGGMAPETLRARAVVVAAGIQREPRIPALATTLPPDVVQLHTAAYRNADQLPPGAVLVVGAAQSGGQIAQDLVDAGRTTYLATSRVGRMRRRNRGRDTMELLARAGFFEQTVDQLPDPALRFAPLPLISGVGRHGHTLSLQWLAARGVRLLGHLRSTEGSRLTLDDDLGSNIRFGDEQSAMVNQQVAAGLVAAGLDATLPPLEGDPADEPHPDPEHVHAPASIDLVTAGITAIIWATGFGSRFDWLPPALLDQRGGPRLAAIATILPGLFALGFPWLRTRGSGIVYGASRDAAVVADLVVEHLAR